MRLREEADEGPLLNPVGFVYRSQVNDVAKADVGTAVG
jgi:hypothetical protein